MREIKFRVWDTLKEQLIINAHFCFDLFFADPKRYIFQQYTGLKDKNGKEIYEGDIVEPVPDSEIKYKVVWNTYQCGYYLVNDRHRMKAITNKPYQEFVLALFVEPFERVVIGNIYENPELMP